MKFLLKAGVLNSNSCNYFLHPRCSPCRIVQSLSFSVLHSKSIRNSTSAGDLNSPRESPDLGPLFKEILVILGSQNVEVDQNAPVRFLPSNETQLTERPSRVLFRRQGVCENAEGKRDDVPSGNSLISGNHGKGTDIADEFQVKDASEVVQKVTEIVRNQNVVISMEERLDNTDFFYNEEVVDYVLKRCFKVPKLALRFFNWVKSSKGFQHTANTFNAMINIAGEAKDIVLVEELAEEMDKNACQRDVKTWTALVSHYGKSKLIGKALLAFEGMQRAGVVPDSVAYRIMLRALCNAGKADLALEYYKDMHDEVKLDVGLYKQLLKCFAFSGDAAAVRLVGENMGE